LPEVAEDEEAAIYGDDVAAGDLVGYGVDPAEVG
jgi:hypothetical protein